LDWASATGVDRWAGERAVPNRPNLDFPGNLLWEDLRLEHKFQTAMKATARTPSQFLSIAHGIGTKRFRQFVCWHTRRTRGFGCPYP
jgi:hypothetical protein